jgi:hypothetical protein
VGVEGLKGEVYKTMGKLWPKERAEIPSSCFQHKAMTKYFFKYTFTDLLFFKIQGGTPLSIQENT